MRRENPDPLDGTSPTSNALPGHDDRASGVRLRVHGGNVALMMVIAGLGCAADLLSKAYVWRQLGPPGAGPIYWIWPEYVGFESSINTGALFGFGQGQVGWLAAISFVAMAAVFLWVIVGGASRDRLLCVAVGLILGGIVGNLYDRLGLWGIRGVRDWILLRYGEYTWPNFNIADSLLVCGTGVILWLAFRQEPQKNDTSTPSASIPAEPHSRSSKTKRKTTPHA